MEKSLIKVVGIKCDNPECNFRDDSVQYEDYYLWLNKPCPKCGQNLLTEKDFMKCQKIMKFSKFLGKFIKLPKDYNGEMDVKIRVNWNATEEKELDLRMVPTEQFKNDYEGLKFEDKNAINKINKKWLEDKLTKAASEGHTKTFKELSVDTKNILLYVYQYENLILRYYFKCTDKDISKYKATADRKNIIKVINTVPNVEQIFENCCN